MPINPSFILIFTEKYANNVNMVNYYYDHSPMSGWDTTPKAGGTVYRFEVDRATIETLFIFDGYDGNYL